MSKKTTINQWNWEVMKEMFPYADLQFDFDSIYDSDYEPFEAEGYVVIGVYDGSTAINNPNYHSSLDVPSLIDWRYLTSVTSLISCVFAEDITIDRMIPFSSVKICLFVPSLLLSVGLCPTVIAPLKMTLYVLSIDCQVQLIPKVHHRFSIVLSISF